MLVGGSGQRYTVGPLRSEGGQGWVFLATVDPSSGAHPVGVPAPLAAHLRVLQPGQTVIVKMLRADALSHEGRVRFHREAQVLRILSEEHSPCPNVVRFHDYSEHELGLHDGRSMLLPFTVLEYVHGTSLDQELSGAPLALARVRTILRDVTVGLEYVHARGVVHRDLKPANILLAGIGSNEQAKVTDFGLVRIVSPDLARTARIAGASVGYAPPEQYERGNARVSPRTDVFSLGAVVFEMLTGRPAYPYSPGQAPMPVLTKILSGKRPPLSVPPGSPLAAAHDVRVQLEREIHRALSPEPHARQASARELAAAVEHLLSRIDPITPSAVASRTAGSAPAQSTSATPPRWLFRGTGARATEERWKSAVFGSKGSHALVLGESAFYLVSVERILAQKAPAELDMRALTGLQRMAGGALIAFGEAGVIGSLSVDLGVFEAFQRPAHDVTFRGAVMVGDTVVGFGARARAGAAVVVYHNGRIVEDLELDAPEIMCGVCTQLGRLVLGTCEGRVLRRSPRAKFVRSKLCDADLLSMACDGERIFVVGRGGHALHIDAQRKVMLEPVQTTRDLHVVQVHAGVAWAAGVEGRVLVREGSTWVRAEGAALSTGTPLALHVTPRQIEVLWSDGAFTRGTLLENDA